MECNHYIAGCRHIAKSLKRDIFAPLYEELLGDKNACDAEVGVKPNMPNRSVDPIETKTNAQNISPMIDGLLLTWLRVERLGPYGVYYNVIALYGDRHWVTQDRSGALFLSVFEVPF